MTPHASVSVVPLSREKKFCSHVGQMIFVKRYAFCQYCEMHWSLGEWGWIPDDPEYKGTPKFGGKRKWKSKK